jgi:hypothetical protein
MLEQIPHNEGNKKIINNVGVIIYTGIYLAIYKFEEIFK